MLPRGLLLWFAAMGLCAQQQGFDILIIGGRIIDGAGTPWFLADIGVNGDTIAAVGRLAHHYPKLRVDAAGLTVAPGFIDIHSHAGRGAAENPSLESLVRQGVTTVLEGNDGGSPVPLGPALEKIAAVKPSINFGFYTGQGSIRSR